LGAQEEEEKNESIAAELGREIAAMRRAEAEKRDIVDVLIQENGVMVTRIEALEKRAGLKKRLQEATETIQRLQRMLDETVNEYSL